MRAEGLSDRGFVKRNLSERSEGIVPQAEKGVRGTGRQPLSPPQRCRDPERDQRSVSAPHERIVRFNFR